MKTFKQFIAEASNRRLHLTRFYHGTPEHAEKKIKKSGFNTSDVYATTDREIAQSFGSRYDGKTKVISFRAPSKDVDTPGKIIKTDGQRGVDKWGREHYSVVMNPDYAKKHIIKEPSVIHSPKIPAKYKKSYFKDNPNSRFKRRTRIKLKRQ